MRCKSSDISVVVQGPVDKVLTKKVLEGIKEILPDAQIILSTWLGEKVEGLIYDNLVLSEDPGSEDYKVDKCKTNINRQLVSTKAGIKVAERRYLLKTRTDIVLMSDSFLDFFQKYERGVYKEFTHRLLINSFYTRNPRMFPLMYHPSDWCVFGFREDVEKYYSCPLLRVKDEERYWLSPEQYIFTEFIKRYEDELFFDSNSKKTKEAVINTERKFAECFVVLDYKSHFGIDFVKYNPNRYHDAFSLISFNLWKILYGRYCEKYRSWKNILGYGCYTVVSNLVGCMIMLRRYIQRRNR